MTTSPGDLSSRPLERFKATSGQALGWGGLVFAAVIVGYVALAHHTLTGLRVALGMTLFGVVVWMTQLRSRATLYPDRVVLKNATRDTVIPLVLVDAATVRQTLNVWVGERRFVCVGIGRSVRSIVKEGRRKGGGGGLLGQGRWREFAERAERAAPDQTAMAYETFVVTRIEEVAAGVQKTASSAEVASARVRQQPAWPELVALLVVGLAFVISLLV
jgi:hypothetical protein